MSNFVNSHPKWLRALSKTDSVPFGQRSDWLKHVDHPGVRIAKTAWVENRENVAGNAQVSGRAQVYDSARVYGNAWVYGNARVYDSAWVDGSAWVYGNARVYDSAWVDGSAQVCGNARVYDEAQVFGDARVSGSALIQSAEDYITVGPVGSRKDTLTVFRTEDSVMLSAGCFMGTEQEFMARLDETDRHLEYWRLVPPLIDVLRRRCGFKKRFSEEVEQLAALLHNSIEHYKKQQKEATGNVDG